MSEESKRQAAAVVERIFSEMNPHARWPDGWKDLAAKVIAEALEAAWKQGFADCELRMRLDKMFNKS